MEEESEEGGGLGQGGQVGECRDQREGEGMGVIKADRARGISNVEGLNIVYQYCRVPKRHV